MTRHYGYPEKIVRILENAYRDTFSAVRINRELSDWFEMIMRVLQGCVLSPLLFNIFLEMIMAMALEGADIGGEKIGDMRFADDIALLFMFIFILLEKNIGRQTATRIHEQKA